MGARPVASEDTAAFPLSCPASRRVSVHRFAAGPHSPQAPHTKNVGTAMPGVGQFRSGPPPPCQVVWPCPQEFCRMFASKKLPEDTMAIGIGETAPDFTLQNQDKKEVKLSDFTGKKNVVLVWYP